jgi:hypothetical protein
LVVLDPYALPSTSSFWCPSGAEESIIQYANLPVGLCQKLYVICQFLTSAITEDFDWMRNLGLAPLTF